MLRKPLDGAGCSWHIQLMDDDKTNEKKGFGLLAPEVLREIARKGGVAAHAVGAAHEYTVEEAIVAGRKGGLASAAKSRATREAARKAAGRA